MIGLNPNVSRSNGVTRWRLFAGAANAGPSGGNFSCVADCVLPHRFVTPSSRFEKPYEPATLIGTETSLTVIRAEPLTTASTLACSTSGFLRYFVFVQRYVSV